MTEPESVDDDSVDRLLASSAVFGSLDDDARSLIRKDLELRVVRRGETLLREGDPADGMYLVASGRLQAFVARDDGSAEIVNEIGRGELVGEIALLTERPRAATVVAIRDSHVLFLSTESFSAIAREFPQSSRAMTTAVVDRLMATIHGRKSTSPATSVAIIPLDDHQHVREFEARLAEALARISGRVALEHSEDAERALAGDTSSLARASWREQLESAHDIVLYAGHHHFDAWTESCARHADVIVFVAKASTPSRIRPVETAVRQTLAPVEPRAELVLLHDASTRYPSHTAMWLDARTVQRHHHVRVDRQGDAERVARFLAGTAVGVVFSGGGARGVAHIGVYRALLEHGVPIDATAGASIGALVAGAVARGDTPDEIGTQLRAAVAERSPLDITLPAVALASGGRVTRRIIEAAKGLDLEDTWLSFQCVSTNLTRGALEIHDRGPAWAAVRASFAVPGLFPAMQNDAGDVLVDGGVVDNLPVSPLRAAHPGISVIASDVGVRREFISSIPPSGVVSGWRHLAQKVRRREFDDLMTLPKILLRLTELSSSGDDDRGDTYIRPELAGVSLLDFDRFDDLVALGYRDAKDVLRLHRAPGEIDLVAESRGDAHELSLRHDH